MALGLLVLLATRSDVLMLPCPFIAPYPVTREPFGLPSLGSALRALNVLLVQFSSSLAMSCSDCFSFVIIEIYILFHSVLLCGHARLIFWEAENLRGTADYATNANNSTC